jgi:hypothetical protein
MSNGHFSVAFSGIIIPNTFRGNTTSLPSFFVGATLLDGMCSIFTTITIALAANATIIIAIIATAITLATTTAIAIVIAITLITNTIITNTSLPRCYH